jgi:hypothetical protein
MACWAGAAGNFEEGEFSAGISAASTLIKTNTAILVAMYF